MSHASALHSTRAYRPSSMPALKGVILALLGVLAGLVLVAAGTAEAASAPEDTLDASHRKMTPSNTATTSAQGAGFMAGLHDHAIIGTRITAYALLEDRKNTFLGSIDKLDAEQDLAPYKIFADWMFTPRYGMELTWDRLEAKTITTVDRHNDGNLILKGPILTAFIHQPVEFNPHTLVRQIDFCAGAGVAYFLADFDHVGWWHYGFDGGESYEDWQRAQQEYNAWVASGAPPDPNGGYTRTMTPDDAIGLVLTAACSTEIMDRLSLELYLRYTYVEVDDRFDRARGGDVFATSTATFPMSNFAGGLGVKFAL